MAKFIITLDSNKVGEYQIDKACLTIGRDKNNDIHLDNLSVSGHHAKITIKQ